MDSTTWVEELQSCSRSDKSDGKEGSNSEASACLQLICSISLGYAAHPSNDQSQAGNSWSHSAMTLLHLCVTSQDSLQNSVATRGKPATGVQGRPYFCVGVVSCMSQHVLVSNMYIYRQILFHHFFGQPSSERHVVAESGVEPLLLDAGKFDCSSADRAGLKIFQTLLLLWANVLWNQCTQTSEDHTLYVSLRTIWILYSTDRACVWGLAHLSYCWCSISCFLTNLSSMFPVAQRPAFTS